MLNVLIVVSLLLSAVGLAGPQATVVGAANAMPVEQQESAKVTAATAQRTVGRDASLMASENETPALLPNGALLEETQNAIPVQFEATVALPETLEQPETVEASRQQDEQRASSLSLANLPFYFAQNMGQVNREAHFHGNNAGGAQLFFTPKEMALVLSNEEFKEPSEEDPEPKIPPGQAKQATVLRMKFKQARHDVAIEAVELQEGLANYLLGNDANEWQTGLPTYGAILYRGLYDGIDLRWEGAGAHIKSTYTVAPGADPDGIEWQWVGAREIRLDEESGDLLIYPEKVDEDEAPDRQPVREYAPVAWQEIGGEQVAVGVRFAVGQNGKIGFELEEYDAALPLFIDPVIDYVEFVGGSSYDYAYGMTVDGDGDVYITGTTYSSDFPTTNTISGGGRGYVAKYRWADGVLDREFSTVFGGSSTTLGRDVAVDGTEHMYIGGVTYSSNFPVTAGAYDTTHNGSYDGFVIKLTPDGTGVVYGTYLGGSGYDTLEAIVIDGYGKAYVTGQSGTSFLPPPPASLYAHAGGNDAFVVALNATGSGLDFSTFLGGSSEDRAHGLALDSSDNIWVVGSTSSANFVTVNALDPSYNGGYDVFATKLSTNGSMLTSTYIGAGGGEYGYGVDIDANDDVYVVGITYSGSAFPAVAITTPITNTLGGRDIFVNKLAADGSAFVYGARFGGSGSEDGYDVAVMSDGKAAVTGYTLSSNFARKGESSTAGGFVLGDAQGGFDAFISILEPAGDDFWFSAYLGTSQYDIGKAIAVDGWDNIYVAGYTMATGVMNAFLVKDSTEESSSYGDLGLPDLKVNAASLFGGNFQYGYPLALPSGAGGLWAEAFVEL